MGSVITQVFWYMYPALFHLEAITWTTIPVPYHFFWAIVIYLKIAMMLVDEIYWCPILTYWPPGDMGVILDMYRQTSNTSRTLIGNKLVDHSDVDETSPVGAGPTISSFST